MKLRLLTLALALLLLSTQWLPTIAQNNTRTVTGEISDETPFIEVPVDVTRFNDTLILDIQPTSGNLDTLLYLVDDLGNIIAQNDDRSKDDFSSYLEFPQIPRGNYTVIVTRFGVQDGDTSGEFALDITLESNTTSTFNYDVSEAALLAAGFPTTDPQPIADWTVIGYYGGDTNLEPGVLRDFKEFELGGGSTSDVRVIMLLDRHPEFATDSGNWSSTRIFEVQADSTAEIDGEVIISSEAIVDLGDIDSGSGEVFAQYLTWVVRNYPARNYALALASHGAGWRGIITDDSESTILNLPEMAAALDLALANTDVARFDLMINDACLMSSIEYHQTMSRYFDYSLASPEIVVDPALDMAQLIQTLQSEPEVNIEQLGEALVDTYISRDIQLRPGADNVYLTNAVINLTRFDSLIDAINSFARIVTEQPQVYSSTIGLARRNTYTYTEFVGGDELIDLGNFMQQVILNTNDLRLRLAAERVIRNLENALVYGDAGDRAARQTTYHNIFFPENSRAFSNDYFEETELDAWGEMLRSYFNAVTPQVWTQSDDIAFHQPITPRINLTGIFPTDEVSTTFPLGGFLEVVGRKIATGDLSVDQLQPDGTAIRLLNRRIANNEVIDGAIVAVNDWSPGFQVSNFNWEATLPVVTDGTTSNNELLLIDGIAGVASLEGRYQEVGSDLWNDVTVVFDTDGVVQRIVNRTEGTNALGVITIPEGARFQAYRSVVSPDGRVLIEPGTEYTWPISWTDQPAPTGDYDLGLTVTAFGGTSGFTSVRTFVNNLNVDPSLRADINSQFNFVLPRPANWSQLGLSPNPPFFSTSDDEGNGRYRVYLALPGLNIPAIDGDLASIANAIIDFYDLQSDRIFTPASVDGQPVLTFDYTLAEGDDVYDGRAFARLEFVQGFAVGLVFAAEVRNAAYDTDSLFNIVTANARFFDPSQRVRNTEWNYNGQDIEGTLYPLPIEWSLVEDDSTWLRYTASGTAEDLTFAALQRLPAEGIIASDMRDNLLTEAIAAQRDNFVQDTTRTYNADNNTWEVAIYTAERDGTPVYGRLYVTTKDDGNAYAIWVESAEAEASTTFIDQLEIVVDGFQLVD